MADFKTIETEEMKKWIDGGEEFVLIDVLGEDSYESRHLPGAANVPLSGDNFLKSVANIADKDDTVVVYCASEDCQASPKAAKKLVNAGYSDVYDYERGLAGWKDAGHSFGS